MHTQCEELCENLQLYKIPQSPCVDLSYSILTRAHLEREASRQRGEIIEISKNLFVFFFT